MNINTLTPEQLKALEKQLKAKQALKKARIAQNKEAYKDLIEQFISENMDGLVRHKAKTEDLVSHVFKEIESLISLKLDLYGVERADQDSHTFTTPDGRQSITIGYNVHIGFDGTESAGVEKIKTYINSLASDSENVMKLSKMVNTFLKPNAKTGMLNPAKIIELSRLRQDFNSPLFDEGLEIIFAAQQRRQNSMYVSGWQIVEVEGLPKKIEFRFTV